MYIIDYRVLYSGIPSHCLLCSICSHSEKRKEKIEGKKKTKKKNTLKHQNISNNNNIRELH